MENTLRDFRLAMLVMANGTDRGIILHNVFNVKALTGWCGA